MKTSVLKYREVFLKLKNEGISFNQINVIIIIKYSFIGEELDLRNPKVCVALDNLKAADTT